MSLKDILVCMNTRSGTVVEVTEAITLAHAHSAHLTGLYLLPTTLKQTQHAEIESAETAGRAFTAAAKKVGVSADWITAHSDFSSPARTTRIFNNYARLADLTILRQGADVATELHHGKVLESVILGSGRPVLMLPDNTQTGYIGKRIIVAWDHSKEAARAVNDALPLLHKAETVEVVTVGLVAVSSTGEDVPGTALCKHLSRHGIVATASKIRALESTVGEALIATAERGNADLIVLGAYGRAKAEELLLAEVTGSMLENTRIAVFLSH